MTDEQKAQKMAEKMGKNASKEDIDNVAENLDSMNKGPLAEVWDKIQAMWNAFKSPATPAYIKAIIIGGLIYVVSPLDIVPDFIPVVGLLDDVGVVGVVFSQLIRLGIIGAAAYAVITFLDSNTVKEYIKKKQHEYTKKIMGAKIEKMQKEGNYNRVNIGLYDENNQHMDTFTVDAETVDPNEIYEGKLISIL